MSDPRGMACIAAPDAWLVPQSSYGVHSSSMGTNLLFRAACKFLIDESNSFPSTVSLLSSDRKSVVELTMVMVPNKYRIRSFALTKTFICLVL